MYVQDNEERRFLDSSGVSTGGFAQTLPMWKDDVKALRKRKRVPLGFSCKKKPGKR